MSHSSKQSEYWDEKEKSIVKDFNLEKAMIRFLYGKNPSIGKSDKLMLAEKEFADKMKEHAQEKEYAADYEGEFDHERYGSTYKEPDDYKEEMKKLKNIEDLQESVKQKKTLKELDVLYRSCQENIKQFPDCKEFYNIREEISNVMAKLKEKRELKKLKKM